MITCLQWHRFLKRMKDRFSKMGILLEALLICLPAGFVQPYLKTAACTSRRFQHVLVDYPRHLVGPGLFDWLQPSAMQWTLDRSGSCNDRITPDDQKYGMNCER